MCGSANFSDWPVTGPRQKLEEKKQLTDDEEDRLKLMLMLPIAANVVLKAAIAIDWRNYHLQPLYDVMK